MIKIKWKWEHAVIILSLQCFLSLLFIWTVLFADDEVKD